MAQQTIPLIRRVRHAETFESECVNRYLFRFHPHGWAIFYVDHDWGGLTITSDWGSWSHIWGGGPAQWGRPTFLEFLSDRSSCNYLADKLSYGRTRDVPDEKATAEGMKQYLVNLQEQEGMTPDEMDRAVEAIERFTSTLGADGYDAAYNTDEAQVLGEYFDCLHEWIMTTTAPKVVFLLEQLLPVFIAHLNGELKLDLEGIHADQRS